MGTCLEDDRPHSKAFSWSNTFASIRNNYRLPHQWFPGVEVGYGAVSLGEEFVFGHSEKTAQQETREIPATCRYK